MHLDKNFSQTQYGRKANCGVNIPANAKGVRARLFHWKSRIPNGLIYEIHIESGLFHQQKHKFAFSWVLKDATSTKTGT